MRAVCKMDLICAGIGDCKGRMLNLGGSGDDMAGKLLRAELKKKYPGMLTVDINRDADIIANFNLGLPFPDSSEKVMLATDIIEHLDNPFLFLKECHRILEAGGKLLLSTPNATGLHHLLRNEELATPFHLYTWLPYQLESLVEKAGFKLLTKDLYNNWSIKYLPLKLAAEANPKFQGYIFITAIK